MDYEWDPNKCAYNIAHHGIDFAIVGDFDWSMALVTQDDRFDYDEVRYRAFGPIFGRLHALAFTMRGTETVRVISLRKAEPRERRRYEREIQRRFS